MVLIRTNVLMVEQASKVAATSVCLQEKFQLPPDSLGGSPRSVNGSEPVSLQITASALYLDCVRFCMCPLE